MPPLPGMKTRLAFQRGGKEGLIFSSSWVSLGVFNGHPWVLVCTLLALLYVNTILPTQGLLWFEVTIETCRVVLPLPSLSWGLFVGEK